MALTRKQQAALDALGTERRRRFVVAYVGEAMGNATKAALLAGYSADTATAQGSALLSFRDVAEAVDLLRKPKRDRRIMRMGEAQQLLTRIARAQEQDTVVTKDGDGIAYPMKTDPNLNTRMKAVELIGRVQGVFVTKVDAKVEASMPKSTVEARAKIEALVRQLGGRVTWDAGEAIEEGDDGQD